MGVSSGFLHQISPPSSQGEWGGGGEGGVMNFPSQLSKIRARVNWISYYFLSVDQVTRCMSVRPLYVLVISLCVLVKF